MPLAPVPRPSRLPNVGRILGRSRFAPTLSFSMACWLLQVQPLSTPNQRQRVLLQVMT